MINKTWYPTPPALVSRMDREIDWTRVNSILDPSAGRGDLLVELVCSGKHEYYSNDDKNAVGYKKARKVAVYAIEIDPGLRGSLSTIHMSHGNNDRDPQTINIIGSDFFEYNGFYEIDCIVMNPPFDRGDEHLLKAIEIMRTGQIICILNSATITNPYSRSRQILAEKIKKWDGKIIDIGNPFSKDADRTANVKCVMVVLKITKDDPFLDIDFSKMDSEIERELCVEDDGKYVVKRDEIKAAILWYEQEIIQYKNCLKSIKEFRYAGGEGFGGIEDYQSSYNQYIKEATIRAWSRIINLGRFSRFMTRDVRSQFMRQILSVSCMEFTEKNIMQFLDSLVFSYENIMLESLIDIFDRLTKYDKLNVTEREGWWTNDSFRVNRKVILPYIWSSNSIGRYIDYNMGILLNDMDRVMMWLSGERLNDINNPDGEMKCCAKYKNGIVETLNNAEQKFQVKHESHFFYFRVYKKNTIHLIFRNDRIWQLFNIRVAEKKNWLPDDYKARRKDAIKKGRLIEYR